MFWCLNAWLGQFMTIWAMSSWRSGLSASAFHDHSVALSL